MLLVVCWLSCHVNRYEDSNCHWCVSILPLLQLASGFLLVRLSGIQSFSRYQFCFSPSYSLLRRLHCSVLEKEYENGERAGCDSDACQESTRWWPARVGLRIQPTFMYCVDVASDRLQKLKSTFKKCFKLMSMCLSRQIFIVCLFVWY